MDSNYQSWLNRETEWMGSYCRRTRKTSIFKVVPMTLVGMALVFGVLGALGGSTGELLSGAVAGLALGVIVCVFYLVILLIGLRPGWYVRKLEKSVRALEMDETERELLGREMLAALESGQQVLSYQIVGPNSNGTPARVILTPHYIIQEGSSPQPLIRRSDIVLIKTGSERKTATTHKGQTKQFHYFTLYTIGFYRRDRAERRLSENDLPDYGMGFFQEELRDDVVRMIEQDWMRVTRSEE